MEPRPRQDEHRSPAGRARGVRAALALALTALAAATGVVGVLATFRQDHRLDVATVRMSVHPGEDGSLALYVPLVDWGVRFSVVRLPAQLRLDVRSVDRAAAERIAQDRQVDLHALRSEVRDAVARYLRTLVLLALAGGLALGALVALALRSRDGPRVRWLLACAGVSALACTTAVALLLPPHGPLDTPEYFAHGADIPRALRAVETVERSSQALGEELDAQLVGLARLVVAPAGRQTATGAPRLTLASDVHNNVLVLPALRRAAAGGPLFLAGDLTDRGSRLETAVTRTVAHAGDPLVFVSGNHDSAALEGSLAQAGAVVLTRRGRLRANGTLGPRVVRIGGLRVAGYDDPFLRRSGQAADVEPHPTVAQQAAFDAWLRTLQPDLDVVMVHQPALAAQALRRLAASPPAHPLVFLVGHTHEPDLRAGGEVIVLNAGTAGGGGTGNLTEHQPIGVAVLTYALRPRFEPLAADLVTIDPGSGDVTASRQRLDLGSPPGR
ncbi:MAG TPA: metallophosphoesterase [Conexibacter sp.]|nr:metallophosphoesterase [Conexibacter sp.]